MGKKKSPKLPKLNLTPEQIAEVLKNTSVDKLLPPSKPKGRPYLGPNPHCEVCHGSGTVTVYGPGPNMPCPACGPRY